MCVEFYFITHSATRMENSVEAYTFQLFKFNLYKRKEISQRHFLVKYQII